jgi:hypothetical protein
VAGHIKISLHASGSWQHSYTAESAARLQIQERHFDRWQRPPELAVGWARALQIVVSHADLRVNGAPSAGVQSVPAHPRFGNATAVTVLLEEQGATAIRVEEAVHVGTLDQYGGGAVVVVAQPVDLPQPVLDQLADVRRQAAATLDPTRLIENETPRIALFGRGATGADRIVFELAIDPMAMRGE